MKKIIFSLILMFASFFVSALFLSSTGMFNIDGSLNVEKTKEILVELDKIPYVQINLEDIDRGLNHFDGNIDVFCLPSQRGQVACIEIYEPVCAMVNVQCVKAPCDPVKETYANSCKACSNPDVFGYDRGEC